VASSKGLKMKEGCKETKAGYWERASGGDGRDREFLTGVLAHGQVERGRDHIPSGFICKKEGIICVGDQGRRGGDGAKPTEKVGNPPIITKNVERFKDFVYLGQM